MNSVLGVVAAVLHGLLMPVAGLLLVGLEARARALLQGDAGPSVLLPLRAMGPLLRKRRVRAEAASILAGMAPVLVFAATWAAAFLVPSFSREMALAGTGDLVAVAGLLMLGRLLGAVLAGGIADPVALLAEPALLLAAFGLAAGGAAGPVGVAGLALAGMAVGGSRISDGASGSDLALLQAAAGLRRLVLFSAVVLAVPGVPGGVEWWAPGLLLWGAIVGMLAIGLAVAEVAWAPWRPARRREGVLAGLVLAGVAVLLGLAECVP